MKRLVVAFGFLTRLPMPRIAADMADFAGMNRVWEAWIDPANPPARATWPLPKAVWRSPGAVFNIGYTKSVP